MACLTYMLHGRKYKRTGTGLPLSTNQGNFYPYCVFILTIVLKGLIVMKGERLGASGVRLGSGGLGVTG